MNGYLFTPDGETALSLIGTGGVRYAARMADGSGFAAFDSNDDIGSGTAAVGGWIVTAMEPHPDYPPSWPQHPHGPKRQIATGDERFMLFAASDRRNLPVPRAAAWVTDGLRLLILVEVGPEWTCGVEPVWASEVVEFRDVRLPVSA